MADDEMVEVIVKVRYRGEHEYGAKVSFTQQELLDGDPRMDRKIAYIVEETLKKLKNDIASSFR